MDLMIGWHSVNYQLNNVFERLIRFRKEEIAGFRDAKCDQIATVFSNVLTDLESFVIIEECFTIDVNFFEHMTRRLQVSQHVTTNHVIVAICPHSRMGEEHFFHVYRDHHHMSVEVNASRQSAEGIFENFVIEGVFFLLGIGLIHEVGPVNTERNEINTR